MIVALFKVHPRSATWTYSVVIGDFCVYVFCIWWNMRLCLIALPSCFLLYWDELWINCMILEVRDFFLFICEIYGGWTLCDGMQIIKEWTHELQERTSKFRKQAEALGEWDRRIITNRNLLIKLEVSISYKVFEVASWWCETHMLYLVCYDQRNSKL